MILYKIINKNNITIKEIKKILRTTTLSKITFETIQKTLGNTSLATHKIFATLDNKTKVYWLLIKNKNKNDYDIAHEWYYTTKRKKL